MKIAKALVYFAFVTLVALIASAQTSSVESRIAGPIDDSQRTVLHGNVYPLARPEFDRGPAPANLPMEHMWLVLKRSPAQETALEALLAQQQDKTSPNYHKWLTPTDFGLQFGPSAQDISTVVQWLTSHGLGVYQVTHGRGLIEFSGIAAAVQQAFHTQIHMYDVNGEQHYANATDPEIPTALTPLVVGVHGLHNFKLHPAGHRVQFSRNGVPLRRIAPQYTYPSGCTPTGSNANCNFALGPADFGTIYNAATLWSGGTTGSGQKIAVLGQATVNMTDVTTFYQLFGVTPTPHAPIVTGPAAFPPPTLAESDASGDEGESDLDLEWSSSVAPGAQVYFVTSSTVDDSAVYAVDTNVVAQIIGLSYGLCEALNQAGGGNTMYNDLWQQAQGEGITVVVSTGDNLAAGCDTPTAPTTQDPIVPPQPAKDGLAVSGLASTIYNLAVGGTDFNDLTNPTTYWNTSNSGSTQLSAKSYIPETTYNDSCTNAILGGFQGFSNIPLVNCNNTTTQENIDLIAPFGGNGGASNLYAKPGWQAAPGVPNDAARDLPDVAMFAGDGFASSFYIVCESDAAPANGSECDLGDSGNDISGFGGTSASAQVFAGIIALVKQKNSPNTGMGVVNGTLYELASDQSTLSCNSSSPASNCVFNQVTVGNIAAPCAVGSPNCGVTLSGDPYGIFTGCDTSAGYNLATGLGSVNVANLVNGWSGAAASSTADFQLSLQNCNATANVTSPGASGNFGITITAVNGFTGSYTVSASGLPSEATMSSTQTTVDATHTNVTVTVATTAPTTGNIAPSGRPAWPGLLVKIAIPFMAFAAFFLFMSRYRGWSRRWGVGLALATALVLLVGLVSCGGGGGGGGGCTTCSPGTPTGYVSGAILTVTSGSTTHTMPFNVNVE